MGLRITSYVNGVDDITSEDLREEAQGWEGVKKAGTAIFSPDDGSGPMEGFLRCDASLGMIIWGDSMSDWIEADSLEELFKSYVRDM